MNTGDFAAFCGVSKSTLFHYDQIGLLKPASVRENCYREYTLDQAEIMDSIKILQAAGYSLLEIKEHLSQDASNRRACLRAARESLTKQIEELTAMKAYLHKKEKLWQEYLDYEKEGKAYQIGIPDYRYSTKEVSITRHFFSFLTDGNYDILIADSSNHIVLACEGGAIKKSGNAITFFMSIPSESPDLVQMIQKKLVQFKFNGEDSYFITIVPHLYFEGRENAIIKVVVFEKTP